MIRVHGSGIAALAAAKAIANRGLSVERCGEPVRKPLVLLLNRETLDLIADIFGMSLPDDLGHPVERRIVCHAGQEPVTVTAPARAVRIDDLVARLERAVDCPSLPRSDAGPSCYRIDATGRRAALACRWGGQEHRTFGQRIVIAAELSGSATVSVMEMIDRGWLFLFPIATDRIVVQMMTVRQPDDPAEALLSAIAQTSLLHTYVDGGEIIGLSSFEAAPRILPVMAAERWLAVGQAAFSMDPVSGDGVGAALRSAILAAATLSTVIADRDRDAIAHFQRRHERSFAMHLDHVADYYRPLTRHPDWARELLTTCRFLTGQAPERIVEEAATPYALEDGKLVAMA